VDGAWYDVMSMVYLLRYHYLNDQFFIVNMVGFAIEGMAMDAAQQILQYGNPTAEQLERFANDLAALPRKTMCDTTYEMNVLYSLLFHPVDSRMLGHPGPPHDFLYYFPFPIDYNIAGKRLTEFNNKIKNLEREASDAGTWSAMKTYFAESDKLLREKGDKIESPSALLRIPLIRTRSKLLADNLISYYFPNIHTIQTVLFRTNARYDLLCSAVALERYKVAKGNYPDSLDALVVEKYLDEVPIDVFTGRKTLTYKLAPDEGTAFLLYSFGPNERDDGGVEGEDWKREEGDIVLRRAAGK
jgi:hypothetical protein